MVFKWPEKKPTSTTLLENPPAVTPSEATARVESKSRVFEANPAVPPPLAGTPPVGLKIEIEGPTPFEVTQQAEVMLLPKIDIFPMELQGIKLNSVRVMGVSANEAWAMFITEAYRAATADVPGILKMPHRIEPKRDKWPADQPISRKTRSYAVVQVKYEIIGLDGNPVPGPLIAEQQVDFEPGDGLRPTAEIKLTPPYLIKVYEPTDRGHGPHLIVRVKTGSTADRTDRPVAARESGIIVKLKPIDLRDKARSWDAPGIEQAVEEMLRGVEASLRQTEEGAYLRHVPQFQLQPIDRQALKDLLARPDAEPLRVRVSVSATGSEPREVIFELHPKSEIREGWVVVDLGTSASTVVWWDPSLNTDDSPFPQEQFAQLQYELRTLISCDPIAKFGPGAEYYWIQLLRRACETCGFSLNDDPARVLLERITFTTDNKRRKEQFYEVIRQLELHLWTLSRSPKDQDKLSLFQVKMAKSLYEIYTSAFDKVPLGRWNIKIGKSKDEKDGDVELFSSELELKDVYPTAVGQIGRASAERRLRWMLGEDVAPLGAIRDGRFFESPKQFLEIIHEDADLSQRYKKLFRQDEDGQVSPKPWTARQPLQAAWDSLIQTAIEQPTPGAPRYDRVVATYPANLMPEPRRALEQALHELGMVRVYTDFDESISPAIFHIQQLFGNLEEIGCEAFKLQCEHNNGNLWTHHMLVLDIGAGTTDISLVRLEMREILPDSSQYGGRVYQIKPILLGAAGRSRSGGHQLTLGLFRILKQLIASWIVSTPLDTSDDSVRSPATSDPVVYDSGPNDANYLAALDRADVIIPTRYREEFNRSIRKSGERHEQLRRFNTLWMWAEELKIYLSDEIRRTKTDDLSKSYAIDAHNNRSLKDSLERLLIGTAHASKLTAMLDKPVPRINIDKFVEMAEQTFDRSIDLALNMARSSLESYGSRLNLKELTLQSVVLSGRACNLPQVEERLRRELNGPIGKGKAKLLFRRDYAKSATAIGASRARRIIAAGVPDEEGRSPLEGQCKMDLQIKNMFFYLPADFRLGTVNEEMGEFVFQRHTEFSQFGCLPHGVIRSRGSGARTVETNGELKWSDLFTSAQRETYIYRDDGDNRRILWGSLIMKELAANRVIKDQQDRQRNLEIEAATWRLRFEINHHRQVYALLVRPRENWECQPIYDIGIPSDDPEMINNLDAQIVDQLFRDNDGRCPLNVFSHTPQIGRAKPLVYGAEMQPILCLNNVLKNVEVRPVVGWMSPPLELKIPRDGLVTFYLYDGKSNKQLQSVSTLPRLKNPDNPLQPLTQEQAPFHIVYRVVLTADGRFALTIGEEPAYWETENIEEWLRNPPGQIFRKQLSPLKQDEGWWSDPFCGKH